MSAAWPPRATTFSRQRSVRHPRFPSAPDGSLHPRRSVTRGGSQGSIPVQMTELASHQVGGVATGRRTELPTRTTAPT